jgi:hypothetical protein
MTFAAIPAGLSVFIDANVFLLSCDPWLSPGIEPCGK